jgi:hypothetical protein
VGQVQVEGSDGGHALPEVDAFDDDLHGLSGRDLLRPGLQPLLPGGGDLGGQPERVDAGVVVFDVGPELAAELVDERLQTDVVQGGLALLQILHQQVTDDGQRGKQANCPTTSEPQSRQRQHEPRAATRPLTATWS